MQAIAEKKTGNFRKRCSKDLGNYFVNSFAHFFFGVFALGVRRVEGIFAFGEHLVEWCYRLQRYSKTSTVAPRKHLKTTVVLGYIAWHLFRLEFLESRYDEFLFLGYKEDLAAYHLKRLKRYIGSLPEYFGRFQALTSAESILHYSYEGKEFICEPEGILSFKRGRHPRVVICDDILRDPEVRLDITQIKKITEIFLRQVMSLPREGGEVHIVGTPQDRQDLFFVLEGMDGFSARRYRAIVNYKEKKVLWPEIFPFRRLMEIQKNEVGPKAFVCEYQCSPVRAEEGFFKEKDIDKITKSRLVNIHIYKKFSCKGGCFGGLDIGKKTHPSHLAIFGRSRKGRLIQIHSKWMDRWGYREQIAYIKQAIKSFGISRLLYDDTRAEFEGFSEAGELPAEMEGVTFGSRNKFEMAGMFDRMVSSDMIWLLSDERQRRQILNVDNDLRCAETEEGHGDSFWSICLAIFASQDQAPAIRVL